MIAWKDRNPIDIYGLGLLDRDPKMHFEASGRHMLAMTCRPESVHPPCLFQIQHVLHRSPPGGLLCRLFTSTYTYTALDIQPSESNQFILQQGG